MTMNKITTICVTTQLSLHFPPNGTLPNMQYLNNHVDYMKITTSYAAGKAMTRTIFVFPEAIVW